MADSGFGKKMEETSSSSSSFPLITCRQQLNPRKSPQTQISAETRIPRKAINILRSKNPENRRKASTKLLEILVEKPNPDADKSVMVDVDFEDEFNEAIAEIRREILPDNKKMWLWKVDDYNRTDPELQKHKRRTHQSISFGTKAPDELKSLVSLEYSHHIVETYGVKFPLDR